MSKIDDKFLKVWDYQQGAVFLKQDEIYAHRQNLAEFFYREGYKESLGTTEQLKVEIALLNSMYMTITERNEKYKEALEKIADVTSAFNDQFRICSFADFELRAIARKALEEK